MQVQKINNNTPKFQGHGARRFSDVMNRLYREVNSGLVPFESDIIELSTIMKDGTEVSARANFAGGRFRGLVFPNELLQYKKQFCHKLLNMYNRAVTKGKAKKTPCY